LIEMGGAKFNVSTELKHTLIDTTFDYITAKREEYDPGKIDTAVRDASARQSATGSTCSAAPGKHDFNISITGDSHFRSDCHL